MFRINAVRPYNFRSFHGKHSFKLPTAPGLYYITGTNEFEPALDANGAGKSTLLEAIHWCLYGKTSRGLRGTDIVTWGTKSAWVEVDLTVGESSFTVARAQSPNSLSIKTGDETLLVEQDELEKRLRLSVEAFKYGVMTPQYGKSFFEKTPTEKLDVFSDILNLEVWLERSKAAEAAAKELERERDNTASEIKSAQQQLESGEAEIERLSEHSADFKAEQAKAVMNLQAELDDAKAAVSQAKQAARSEPFDAKLEGCEKRVTDLTRQIDQKVGEHAELRQSISRLTGQLDGVTEKMTTLEGVGARCPVCLQTVDAKHITHERDALLDTEHELRSKVKKLRTVADNISAEIDGLRAERRTAEADVQNAHHKVRAAAQLAGQAKAAREAAIQRVTDLEGRLGSLKAKTNPYARLKAEKQATLDGLEGRKRKLEGVLAEIEAEHHAVAYWVTGFKRVRLVIIEETLRSLEVEVNNSLTGLGLADWSVALDIEREKKTGGVTKGFHVFVQCPAHDEPVKWESWSGGETQRLQQAGDFGMSNLIMLQAGLQGAVEFYDEPSQHLSTAGLLDLAETLHQRAVTQGKVILLIDHHTIDFGEFAGVCRITKDEDGSYFGPWE